MKFKQSSDIHSKKIGSEIVLLELDKKHIRQLNSTASFLWEQLKEKKTTNELALNLSTKFKISKNEAIKDIDSWIKDYLEQGFLQQIK